MAIRIISIVSSDPYGDQRVIRINRALAEAGAEVRVVGRRTRKFASRPAVPFAIKRMKLWFNNGFLFYANLNIRLFLLLMTSRYDLIQSNDLDTLWPAAWASRFRKKPLVYDTHEYFTQMPELVANPRVQRFWKRIENRMFCKPDVVYTVNDSIAGIYSKEYKKDVRVVRNIADVPEIEKISREALGLPVDGFLLIMQGTGINVGRGGEQAIEAMTQMDALLLVVGTGTAIPAMRQKAHELKLQRKVRFIDPLPYADLLKYTKVADVGLSLDMPSNLNYRFSLPNKLFDFIHTGTPVLSVDLPEVSNVVSLYGCGVLIPDNQPETIAGALRKMRDQPGLLDQLRAGCAKASRELTWEKEKQKVLEIYKPFLNRAMP